MSIPNIFDYATSELSNDAMICWLLKWAGEDCKQFDENMYLAGQKFYSVIREKYPSLPERPKNLKPKRQIEHADIIAEIDDEYLLVIEDKVDSSDHSDQLRRYRGIFDSHQDYANRKKLYIYFKTGLLGSYERARCADSGYEIIDWVMIREYANWVCVQSKVHPLLKDYANYLSVLFESREYWKSKIIKEWSDQTWECLFAEITEKLNENTGIYQRAGWDHVNNPAGGFYACYWNFCHFNGHVIYLQLEQTETNARLAFRLGEVSDVGQRENARNQANEKISALKEMPEFKHLGIDKPNRYRTGKTMAVACIPDVFNFDDNRILDFYGLLRIINNVDLFMERLAENRIRQEEVGNN